MGRAKQSTRPKRKPDAAKGRAAVVGEATIDNAIGQLSSTDRKVFQRVRRLLAEHLGSDAAAQLWLTSAGTGFETTALDAVRAGRVKQVLATLESQWGPSPSYA